MAQERDKARKGRSRPMSNTKTGQGNRLIECIDAAVWAEEFCKRFPDTGADEGTMIGWFANAMMNRRDHDMRRLDTFDPATERVVPIATAGTGRTERTTECHI